MKKLISIFTLFLCAASGFAQQSTSGYNNGHKYVDLGLSVKWATCNIGATKPEESGDLFAWGETTPKRNYNERTYKWYRFEGSHCIVTKYLSPHMSDHYDDKTTLDLSDDAAHANWGGSWRMPTHEELYELKKKCTWEMMILNGEKVGKITGPNGNSIFLPASGGYEYGYYWSSSLRNFGRRASYMELIWNDDPVYSSFGGVFPIMEDSYRYDGRFVRAVCP